MIRVFRCSFVLMLLTLLASLACAQVQTGAPPFGSFGGGPDLIDLANLNAHITVPVIHKPGRGMTFTYDLSYDTSVWYPLGSTGSQSWQSAPNFGWRGITEVATGYISVSGTLIRTCTVGGNPVGYKYAYRNWTYHDPFGGSHVFGEQSVVDGNCGTGTTLSATANDGSGYQFTANPDATYKLYAANGQRLAAPVNAGSGAGIATDRNGNQITVTNTVVFPHSLCHHR